MALVPWKQKRSADLWEGDWPRSQMTRFRSEMDRLFETFFGRAWDAVEAGYGALAGWGPSVDVSETDTEITVRAELPGVDPKDLEITVSGNMLTLAGQKREETERKGENFYHSERRFGSFRRTVELPSVVDTEKITAEHKNGVVFVRVKKQPGAVPKRIEVKPVEK